MFPVLTKHRIPVLEKDGVSYVPRDELRKRLDEMGIRERYAELYGVQTQYVDGPFPWDVEAVLIRIFTGKRTGTQLIPD